MFGKFIDKLTNILSFNEDAAAESDVIKGIKDGVEFKGAKLWILVLAIFVASLGLNTNSAAVIIGAMLISPLMGPIIGMGLGVGINDFELLRKSFRNYIVATLFSVTTATIYFIITPFAEAQSELLARTSPTIYDVLIALCGGLAGILALSSRSQRTGNVIPGVAIATALMPPLCTVGFGMATFNLSFALGALYLYIINTIFIATATFVATAFILKFKKKTFVDSRKEKRVKRVITTIALITIIPSIVLTIDMVRENNFKRHVSHFISSEIRYPRTKVMSNRSDFHSRCIDVALIGEELDSMQICNLCSKLPDYYLEGVELNILQGTTSSEIDEIRAQMVNTNLELSNRDMEIVRQKAEMEDLQVLLSTYEDLNKAARDIYPELRVLFPDIRTLYIARGNKIYDKSDEQVEEKEILVVIGTLKPLSRDKQLTLNNWLDCRLDTEVHLIVESCQSVK